MEAERDKAERRPELGFLLHLPPVCPRSDPHKPVRPKGGMRKLRARLGALSGSSEVEAQQLCSQVPVKSAGRRLYSTESRVSRLYFTASTWTLLRSDAQGASPATWLCLLTIRCFTTEAKEVPEATVSTMSNKPHSPKPLKNPVWKGAEKTASKILVILLEINIIVDLVFEWTKF